MPRRITARIAALLLAISSLTASLEPAAADDSFRIADYLGRTWRNELVRFPLTDAQLKAAQASKTIVGPDGKAVAYQIAPGEKTTQVVFAVDLNPFESREYRFNSKAADTSDLRIIETDERVALINNQVGISLRKSLKPGEGPITGVLLQSDQWIGGSRLETGRQVRNVESVTTEIIARGPVFAEAVCRVKFEQNGLWELKVRVQAGEPVVLIDESFSLGTDVNFVLDLSRDFEPTGILYRHGAGHVGKNANERLDAVDAATNPGTRAGTVPPAFVLEPWLHWWERQRQGNWCGLYNEKSSDLLMLGAREPGVWVDPQQPHDTQSPPQVFITSDKGELAARFPLRGGTRKWMIGSFDKAASLSIMKETETIGARGPITVLRATLPQKYLIKHGDFPLERVNNYVLDWPNDKASTARLFFSKAEVDALRRRFKPDPVLLDRYRQAPVASYAMDDVVLYYLGTNDAALGRHLAQQATTLIQAEVDRFLLQEHNPTLGAEPHRRANELLPAINLAALVLASEHLQPEQRRRLQGQLAFLAYTVSRPDFYSQARGYAANPNMTSTVSAFQVLSAGAIPSHPMAPAWINGGLTELKRELHAWSDENGGWLEAPHYAVVGWDYLIACFLAAHHAGLGDDLYDPRMKQVGDWLAKISTPRDWRVSGRRHLPPIGNTPTGEPTSEFGLLAYLWRDKDPDFAARMQWMYREQGEFASPGIGGFFPSLAGYRTFLLDERIPAKAPAYTSELFPQTGVVLRHGFPSDRETQLLLIAGNNHAHYDDDSGSFTLWGKGQILADDFGYTGIASAEDHNLVVSPSIAPMSVMQIKEFATTDNLDYVKGQRGGWTRQIAFAKDRDPLGPNYFVIADTLDRPDPAKWQLWLTADQVTLGDRAALVEGKEDVNLEIVFASPAPVQLTTETKTRSSTGLTPNGETRTPWPSTQTGVIASSSTGSFVTVLYPRLKTQKPPLVTSLAEGRVLKVQSSDTTDYVFLSPSKFSFTLEDLSFEGTSGAVRVAANQVTLSLGSAGKLTAKGHELNAEKPTTQTWSIKP